MAIYQVKSILFIFFGFIESFPKLDDIIYIFLDSSNQKKSKKYKILIKL